MHDNVQTRKDVPLTNVLEGMLKLQSEEWKERLDKEKREKEKQETPELRNYSARYSAREDPLGDREAFTPSGMAAAQTRELMKHFIPWGDTEKQ